MAAADLFIRQGDVLPVLPASLTDASGYPLDLSGCTVTFVLRQPSAVVPIVNAPATIIDSSSGAVQYAWSAGDTAVPGFFMGEFHVSGPDGSYTWPNDGYVAIEIEQNLLNPLNQLVTVADAKSYLRFNSSDRTEDANILRFIRAARPLVEQVCGPIIPQQFEEWHDGGQTFIMVNRRPSVAYGTSPMLQVQAISEYQGSIEWPLSLITSPDQASLYSAMVDVRGGRIVRRTAGGAVQAFPQMPQSVHVVYTAGQMAVPDNVYEATLELIRIHYKPTQQQSAIRGPGFGQAAEDSEPTAPVIGFFMPASVREMLAPNRRFPALA